MPNTAAQRPAQKNAGNPRRHSVLLVLAFGLLALWFALQAVNGLAESKRLAQSNASLLAQCEQQERQNQERRAAFDNGSLDKQLEEAARRKGYGYPDEWRYRDSKAG